MGKGEGVRLVMGNSMRPTFFLIIHSLIHSFICFIQGVTNSRGCVGILRFSSFVTVAVQHKQEQIFS